MSHNSKLRTSENKLNFTIAIFKCLLLVNIWIASCWKFEDEKVNLDKLCLSKTLCWKLEREKLYLKIRSRYLKGCLVENLRVKIPIMKSNQGDWETQPGGSPISTVIAFDQENRKCIILSIISPINGKYSVNN